MTIQPPLTYATLNLAALKHNLQRVRYFAPGRAVMAMIKANAYGHDLIQVAQTLDAEVDAFGVARLCEAYALRQAHIKTPIVCMSGFYNSDELAWMSEHQVHAVVLQDEQIALLAKAKSIQPLHVWVKVDTGMHRLGFAPEHIPLVQRQLLACDAIIKPLNWMTHFAKADEWTDPFTEQQWIKFQAATASCQGMKSAANSAAIIKWSMTHADWVRPGLMLYGLSPFVELSRDTLQLKPVMTLHSHIISCLDLRKGDTIGYGGTWACPEAMRVGIIAAGYGDGYPRHAPSGTPVWVAGRLCPIVGRVSMDLISVDLRGHPQAKVGSKVVLWGDALPVETVAQYAGTISYELVTKITRRVNKNYVSI